MFTISKCLHASVKVIVLIGFLAAAGPLPDAHAELTNASLTSAIQADPVKRDVIYQSLSFDRKDWQVGDIVGSNPYAVVSEVDDVKGVTILHVWTGYMRREVNDLYTTWDDIWLDQDGKVVFSILLVENKVADYFNGEAAKDFFIAKNLRSMPWVQIPTDSEANLQSAAKVPSGELMNMYTDPLVNFGIETYKEVIPGKVPGFKQLSTQPQVIVPSDSLKHWSKPYVTDLMQKGVIEGFEDGSIRPNSQLTRSQFVALLARAIGLEAQTGGAIAFIDLKGHWSEGLIRSSQEAGIVADAPVSLEFQPNINMTRSDMIELIGNALVKSEIRTNSASLAFHDTKLMAPERIEALKKAVGAELISGYPDGSFKPDGYLTRAEAFKVISQLIGL